MKKLIYIFTMLAVLSLAAACDSYLDRQPDDMLTSGNIFMQQVSNAYDVRVTNIESPDYNHGLNPVYDSRSMVKWVNPALLEKQAVYIDTTGLSGSYNIVVIVVIDFLYE